MLALLEKVANDNLAPVYWLSPVPALDDFGNAVHDEFVDGATKGRAGAPGPWAIMSPSAYKAVGVGLGTGRGQRYRRQSDGRWKKVEG